MSSVITPNPVSCAPAATVRVPVLRVPPCSAMSAVTSVPVPPSADTAYCWPGRAAKKFSVAAVALVPVTLSSAPGSLLARAAAPAGDIGQVDHVTRLVADQSGVEIGGVIDDDSRIGSEQDGLAGGDAALNVQGGVAQHDDAGGTRIGADAAGDQQAAFHHDRAVIGQHAGIDRAAGGDQGAELRQGADAVDELPGRQRVGAGQDPARPGIDGDDADAGAEAGERAGERAGPELQRASGGTLAGCRPGRRQPSERGDRRRRVPPPPGR